MGTNVKAKCSQERIHYFAPPTANQSQSKLTPGKFRFAGFNAYHMGDKQSAFKKYDWVAQMLDQWDLVGVVEAVSLPQDDLRHNSTLDQLGDSRAKYIPPGYIRLLMELQKLHADWSLLLTPEETGGSDYKELAGFYYRSTKLVPQGTSYCTSKTGKTTEACFLRLPKETEPFVSRRPLVASFRAGSFDFIALVTHVRFREPRDRQVMNMVDSFFQAETWGFTPDAETARFAEVRAITSAMTEITSVTGEKDVILVGDFNLEYRTDLTEPWKKSWEQALSIPDSEHGFSVYVDSKTSVSETARLASEYDHFVLTPDTTTDCVADAAASYDMITAFEPAVLDFTQNFEREKQALKRDLNSQLTAAPSKSKGLQLKPRYSSQQVRAKLTQMNQRLIDSQKSKPYRVYKELLSDHIPIVMECLTNTPDDD